MKKLLSYFAIIALAAITLNSCNEQQAEVQKEVPLKVTYTIDCSQDLLNLCDMVVTYKGDDGVDITDTITATPADTIGIVTWTKTVGTHEIPAKIGFDYAFVQKAETPFDENKVVSLTARYCIIAEKIGIRKGLAHTSDKTINSKTNFFIDSFIMEENVINTRSNLATIIDVYNDRQAYKRGTTNNKTCFIVEPRPNGNGSLMVKGASWNDNDTTSIN